MDYTIIFLFTLSIILFIMSFFKKEQNKEVDRQIENFSITLMQEIYQLKKKIKVLEEEILIGQDERYFTSNNAEFDRDKLLSLYEQGHSYEEISELTGLTLQQIENIIGQ